MKKIFTLIAAALLSSGAFAQSEWSANMVTNTDMEGEQDPLWSSFWCHDYREGVEFNEESNQRYDDGGQFQGFAEIIEDPTTPGNHCARVIARSEAEADEAGNKVEANGSLASWDCQFFIYATDTIPTGMELRMTMRVRAEKDGSIETQAHWAPGDYNFYQLFGNVNVTTEWTKIQVTTTIGESQTGAADGKYMQTVAFNLSTDKEGNVFYFDDVKLEIRKPKQGSDEFGYWLNMLRHGTLSKDQIGERTTFTGRMGVDNIDRPAIVVDDELDGEPALKVTSIGWNAIKVTVTKEELKDDDGNVILDDDGNPLYNEIETESDCYVSETGDTITTIDDWRTQFFVTVPHKFATNSKLRLVMWARADKDAQIDTQTHRMPGDYIHWQAVGSLDLTPEWQCFEFDDVNVSSDMSGNGSFQTIAFNCNKLKEDNNYYFRFEEFSANSNDVTDEERVLASENVRLPIPEPGNEEGVVAQIDFANCQPILEYTSLENLVSSDNMFVASGEDTFAAVDPSAGFYISEAGYVSEDDKLLFEIENVKDSGTTMDVRTYNFGESFEGKTIDTKFRYKFGEWFYIFNVALVSEQTYNGVTEVLTNTQPAAGIYDLMGRRVNNATKGIYIMNGRKYMVK